ncbi:MAG: alpha/beta hydrolase [Pseudomonadota bacterium]
MQTSITVRLSALVFWAFMGVTPAVHANPDQRGPEPTVKSLEAVAGPYAIASAKVTSPTGYGAATVYYPTMKTDGRFGLVVLAPGFLAAQGYYAWLAERAASHGFVVVNINVNSIFDSPAKRVPQLMSALNQVLALSQTATTPYFDMVDPTRLALMGHSAGGGAALAASVGYPTLKAVVAMTPASDTKDFSAIRVPTLVLACEKDAIAPNATYSIPFYKSFDPSLSSAYIEVASADHLSPTFLGSKMNKASVGKYSIAWLKRFVDSDTRYTPFIKNMNSTDLSKYESRGWF